MFREGNQAIDILTKFVATSGVNSYIWDRPLVGLGLILLADGVGTAIWDSWSFLFSFFFSSCTKNKSQFGEYLSMPYANPKPHWLPWPHYTSSILKSVKS